MAETRLAIETEDLEVAYGRARPVRGLSLRVEWGSVYALLGRNGAGKSTLVRCLLGQRRATRGTARLLGRDSWRERRRNMGEVGVVPETPQLPPRLTLAQLFRLRRSLGGWDAEEAERRRRALEVPADVPTGRLSRGQKGAATLVLALAARPRLLLCDDPTLGLDPVARALFYEELIGELADRGTTVFLTTHDLAGVEGLATHVGILHDGTLVADDTVEALRDRHPRAGGERMSLEEIFRTRTTSPAGGEA
jgi:ABC-2 type transport system ATP-binding protein